MPRVGGYASLPDSNADDEQFVNGTNSNSNNTAASAGAAAAAGGIPSAVAVGVGPNDGRGAARSTTASDTNAASAEVGGTYPNISSSDSRGGPASSFRGEVHTQSGAPCRHEGEDEVTPLNPSETCPVEGREAAAAGASHESSSSAKSKTDIDPTDGLPTAEGIFVGAPTVAQSSYHASTVSWPSGAHSDSSSAATVAAAPPSYNAHVAATVSQGGRGPRGGAVVVVPGGQVGGGVGPGGDHRTVILVNNPRFMEQWGRQPQPFTCQSCAFTGFSSTTSVRSVDI